MPMRMRTENYIARLLLVLFLVAGLIGCEKLQPLVERRPSEKMPEYHPAKNVQYLNQNWSAYDRQWFYHAGQGTELMPYAWFMALEQPHLKLLGTVPKFHE